MHSSIFGPRTSATIFAERATPPLFPVHDVVSENRIFAPKKNNNQIFENDHTTKNSVLETLVVF